MSILKERGQPCTTKEGSCEHRIRVSSLTAPLEGYQYFRARGRGEETREIEGNSEMTKGTLFPGHCGGKKIFDINNKIEK